MNYTFDAKNKKLGRLASEIASILQGKKNPDYNGRLAGNDIVTIKNLAEIEISGRKVKQKTYKRHTGYIGHLKTVSYEMLFAKNPAKVLKLAVRRMLPKNRLLEKRMKNLIIENK